MAQVRELAKHTAIYGLGIILGKLAGFLMLPIYTRYLTPADYGVLELLSMTVDVIGTLTGVGIGVSVFRFRAEYEGVAEKSAVMSTAAIAMSVTAAVTASLGLLYSSLLTHLVLKDACPPLFFRMFFLTYLAQTLEAVPLMQLRAQQRSVLFVGVSTAKLLGMLTLNIYFVAVKGMGVLGVLLSGLITTAISAACLTVMLFRSTGTRFHAEKLRKMVKYGAPIVFAFAGNFILVFSGRYYLQHYATTADVGIYSLASRFGFILSAFAVGPFQLIWAPERFVIARQEDAPQTFAHIFTYLNVAVATIALGLVLFAADVLRIMSAQAFWGAAALVPALVAAQVIWCWSDFVNVGLLVRQRTVTLALASTAGVVATLVLNFLLIPRYGMWGAAFSTLLAYVVRFLSTFVAGQRHYRIPYEWQRLARLYGIVIVAAGTRALGARLALPASVGMSVLVAAAALGCTYAVVLNRSERQALLSAVHLRSTAVSPGWLRG